MNLFNFMTILQCIFFSLCRNTGLFFSPLRTSSFRRLISRKAAAEGGAPRSRALTSSRTRCSDCHNSRTSGSISLPRHFFSPRRPWKGGNSWSPACRRSNSASNLGRPAHTVPTTTTTTTTPVSGRSEFSSGDLSISLFHSTHTHTPQSSPFVLTHVVTVLANSPSYSFLRAWISSWEGPSAKNCFMVRTRSTQAAGPL